MLYVELMMWEYVQRYLAKYFLSFNLLNILYGRAHFKEDSMNGLKLNSVSISCPALLAYTSGFSHLDRVWINMHINLMQYAEFATAEPNSNRQLLNSCCRCLVKFMCLTSG